MTIAAAYLVSEGVVLGADSASSVLITGPQEQGVLQVLHHSQKVFEVGENSRFGVCTWGEASVGPVSHRTIIAQLAERIDDKVTTVEQAANDLALTVENLVSKPQIPPQFFVGYNLGGWNPGSHEPECFKIEVSKSGKKLEKQPLGGCIFSGMPTFFSRAFWGYDPRLVKNLIRDLKATLPEVGNIVNFDKKFMEAFKKASVPLVARGFNDLPIREAIDFVYSYLHITVKAIKFMFGAPICGGPIEIGFISSDRRFRWVRHKTFSTAILEQEGGEFDEGQ